MRTFLPTLFATLTRQPRAIVVAGIDFEWTTCWTHNAFRAYELILGRRHGIRFEGGSFRDRTGQQYHFFGTWENVIAHAEGALWRFLRTRSLGLKIVPVSRLEFAGMNGELPTIFRFAIAFDSVTQNWNGGSGASSISVSHTSTGSNLIAISGLQTNGQTGSGVSTVTYNGASMTGLADNPANDGSPQNVNAYIYWLAAPATGSQTVTATFLIAHDNSSIGVCSYSGAAQTGIPDAHSKTQNTSATTSLTVTVTTVAANAWVFGMFRTEVGGATFGSGTTSRYNNGDGGIADSGGAITSPGSSSLLYNFSSSVNCGLAMSFAPAASATVVHPFMSMGMGS